MFVVCERLGVHDILVALEVSWGDVWTLHWKKGGRGAGFLGDWSGVADGARR